MASRQYKKVLGAPTLPPPPSDDSEDDFHLTHANTRNKKNANPFDVLQDSSEEKQDSEAAVEDSSSELERVEHAEPVREEKKKKKRKRKKKNQKKESDGEEEPVESLDEVEQCVREVNRMLGEPKASVRPAAVEPKPPDYLSIDRRYLDVRYEVRRKFGFESLREFYPIPKGDRQWCKKTTLIIYKKESWPRCKNLDLSMTIVDERPDGVKHYAFAHGTEYRDIQRTFWIAMDSGDVDIVREILYGIPYHFDSLLMLIITSRRMEAHKDSDELLDKLLFGMEQALHPSFSLHSGKCRLEYKYQVNRIFHIAILKYIKVVQNQACHRTALELAKMLMSLDRSDPLALVLLIDSIAMMAGEYEWLIGAVEQWDVDFKVLMLPNMAYSYALAKFQLAVEKGEDTSAADKLLERALLMYPKQLLMLLDKCSSRRKREFESEALYTSLTDYTTSQPLIHMMRLYATRTSGVWVESHVLEWLENSAARTLQRFKTELGYVDEFGYYRRMMYVRTPLSVLRHLNVMDVDDVPLLSTDSPKSSKKERITDPYPPDDSYTEYPYLILPGVTGDRSAYHDGRIDRLADMVRQANLSEGEELIPWNQERNGLGVIMQSILNMMRPQPGDSPDSPPDSPPNSPTH